MSDKVVLGIHSAVSKQTQANGGSYDKFIDGHAWLSVTRDGQTQYYGLWPDDHPRVRDNGDGTDIRVGQEKGFRSSADRYYALSPAQVKQLDDALKANVAWSPTTTCAGWASDTVSSVTGKKLAASEFLSIETPRKLAETIHGLEAKEPTAPDRPHAPSPQQEASDSFKSDSPPTRPRAQHLHAPHAAVTDPMYRQAEDAVRRLDDSMGKTYDSHRARMAASLAYHAKDNGLEHIDHVVLNVATPSLKAGENVFVVQGGINDATNRVAQMKTQDALAAPIEHSLGQLAASTPSRAMETAPHLHDAANRQPAQRMTM
jgi:hypothetical protein